MIQHLIDTHFHLDFYQNHNEIYKIINDKKQYTLCMTNSPGVFLSCKNLYPETKYLKFALGFHPLNTSLKDEDFNHFIRMAKNVNYIGEVGLDFKSNKALDVDKQLYYFDKIVELCANENKLFSVHVKGAEKELVEIISKYKPCKCIVHWYGGSTKYLQDLIKLGCYFSFNANMTINTRVLQKVKLIPNDRILIESDGPFSKVNGKKYHPNFLIDIYKSIAIARNNKDLINQVYKNFKTILEL